MKICRNEDPNVTTRILDWELAIIDYGRHRNNCSAYDFVHNFKCTCGFEDILRKAWAHNKMRHEEESHV